MSASQTTPRLPERAASGREAPRVPPAPAPGGLYGAVKRLRPKLLTEGVAIIAIFPMVYAQGVGGEILAPMALPVASNGRKRERCASLPKRAIGAAHMNRCVETLSAVLGQTRASSSTAVAAQSVWKPMPP